MKHNTIRTPQEYTQAMERLEEIFHASAGTEEGAELEQLSILIEEYENEHFSTEKWI